MKKFQNITENGNEKAIRLGTKVPSDAANLAWFKSELMSPSNTLSFIDSSKSIPENVIQESVDNEAFFACADTLGYLVSDKYGQNFPSNNITVSNIPLGHPMSTEAANPLTLNPNDYAHYYYVSRFFTPCEPNFVFYDLDQFLDPDIASQLNIKVINQDGSEYIDPVSSRRKYRVLLENFTTGTNSTRIELPHRIIVLFDADRPTDVRLVYNKVEVDEDGNMFNQELGYSEITNAIPVYQELPEESFVVDTSYSNKRTFSIKKHNEKYSDLLSGAPRNSGFQVITNKKGFKDNRTYEVFNWRLIARSRSSVDFDQIKDGTDIGNPGNIASRTIKAAVVSSSATYTFDVAKSAKPYVFRRLEQSAFNFSNYSFKNPLSPDDVGPDEAEYWMIDPKTLSMSDLYDLDVIYFHVDKEVDQKVADMLRNYVRYNGILIVDIEPSGTSSNYAAKIDQGLRISSSLHSGQSISLNTSNYLIDPTKNGGWTISDSIFEKDSYGIHGNSYVNKNSSYKNYPHFTSVNNTNNYVATIPVNGSQEPIAVTLPRKTGANDAVTTGLIVGVTCNLGDNVNNYVDLSDTDTGKDNYSSTISQPGSNDFTLSSSQEGPFKFFYNIISYGLYLRAQASRSEDNRSSVYNFVSKWRSSWSMDSSVILESELSRYQEVSDSDEPIIYAVDLISGYSNLFEFYKSKLSDLTNFQAEKLSAIVSSSIDFYIEVTNPDIQLKNCVLVSDPLETENVPSSYYLWKVTDSLLSGLMAFTQTYSPKLMISDTLGPYCLKENLVSTSDDIDLISDIDVSQDSFHKYAFDLDSVYSYYQASEKPLEFTADIKGYATIELTGNYHIPGKPGRPESGTPTRPLPPVPAPDVTTEQGESPKVARSAVDEGWLPTVNSRQPHNVYVYTGDIDLGYSPETWSIGDRGKYVRFLQIWLKAWTIYKNNGRNYYPYRVDGVYGRGTTAGIRAFQADMVSIWVDGMVDVQTKSHIAAQNRGRAGAGGWPSVDTWLRNNGHWPTIEAMLNENGVMDAWLASKRTAFAGEMTKANTGKEYKKLSFTGTVGPSEVTDVLYFEVRDAGSSAYINYVVNEIRIKASKAPWNNFTISRWGYSSQGIPKGMDHRSYPNGSPLNLEMKGNNGEATIKVNRNAVDVKYFWVEIKARALGSKYRYAEGFGIDKVIIQSTRTRKSNETLDGGTEPNPDYDPGEAAVPSTNQKVKVEVDLDFTKKGISDIALDSPVNIRYTPANWLSSSNSVYVKAIRFYNNENIQVLSKTGLNIPSSTIRKGTNSNGSEYIYDPDGKNKFSVDLKKLANKVSNVSFVLDKVYDVSGTKWYDRSSGGSSPVDFTYSKSPTTANGASWSVQFSTDATYFSGGQVERVVNTIPFYSLKSVSTGIIFPQRNTIDVLDGVLLLCNEDGTPIGLPSSTEVNSILSNINDIETDKRYGNFAVINNQEERTIGAFREQDGLIYGFYDNSNKEFIGKRIPYLEFVKRGISNIFIGVCATDADGNTMGSGEYFGPRVSQKFIPVTLSMKSVAPLFSVKVNSTSSIKIGNIYSNLSKFDCWELPLYPGQFFKNITVSESAKYSDWKKDYVGQTLYCSYNVSDNIVTSWSDIYGYGHYDIRDEKPIIINEKTIQLRRTPILVWNHPTTYETSSIGGFRPVLKVYIRASITDQWVEVPYQSIRDVNSITGVVTFKRRVIPTADDLIKVDYSTKDKQIYIREVDGNQVPLNPVLTSDSISFIDPLYVYMLPNQIWKPVNSSDTISYELITDYEYTSSIKYTYDSRIFDKTSHLYNPFALTIGIIYVLRNPNNLPASFEDTRTRGGGVVDGYLNNTVYENVTGLNSAWDVQPPSGHAYPNGGYVIIRIPQEVKNHFTRDYEVYDIISSNLTAGVAYELQDMEGNSWG